jgi:hypothetical protein
MRCEGDLWGFNGDLIKISWDLPRFKMGFNGDFMGFGGDIMGLYIMGFKQLSWSTFGCSWWLF